MELSVIIVNYNAEAHLRNCLESVCRYVTLRPFEVIVVDNASTDGSVDMMRREFPEARLLLSRENVGFGRGNNLAMREATGKLFLVLNNDCLVTPGAVETLACVLGERDDVGIVAPRLRNEEGRSELSHGPRISFLGELFQKWLSSRYEAGGWWARRYVERLHRDEARPAWVSGACFLARADVLRRVGYFDESFFMYLEDADLCARVRAAGYQILYTPRADVVHLKGRSTETNRERAAYEYRRSQLRFYEKHYGRYKVMLLKPYLLGKVAFSWLLSEPSERAFQKRLWGLIWSY